MKLLPLAVVIAASLVTGAALADPASDFYTAQCKGCHGPDGKAQTKTGKEENMVDISTAEWQAKHTDAEIKKVILEGGTRKAAKGGPSKMKPQADKLKEANVNVDDMVKIVRSLKRG